MLTRYINKYRKMPIPAKAGIWFTVCSIAQRGLSVISMPVFTRLLSPESYGTYSLYTSWNMLFSLVVTLNLSSEIFNKGLADYEEDRSGFSTSQAALITVLVLVFYCVYYLFRVQVNAVTGMDTILTSCMFLDIYSTAIVGLWFARKRFDFAYRSLIAVTLLNAVASIVLGIILVKAVPEEWKVTARVVGNIIPTLIVATAVLVGFLRASHRIYSRDWWRRSIRLGVPLVPHYASQVLLNQADKVLIGWFLNNVCVAIYGVAHSAGLLLTMVNNGINSSFVPWLYGRLRGKAFDGVDSIANQLIAVVVVLVFLLMLVAPECVAILATDDYRDAVWCIPPIATGVVFAFIYTLFVNVEIYYGKTGYVAIASVASAILNVALNLAVIPLYGYIASAFVTSACYLATAALHYVFMCKTLRDAHISSRIYDMRFIGLSCLLTLVSAGMAELLYLSSAVRYVLIVVILLTLFFSRNRIMSSIICMRQTR